METVEERPRIIEVPGRKTIKVWSDNLQRYYRKSSDPNYYVNYFHKTKHPMTCEFCGRTVNCQMYSHRKSQFCIQSRTRASEKRTARNNTIDFNNKIKNIVKIYS